MNKLFVSADIQMYAIVKLSTSGLPPSPFLPPLPPPPTSGANQIIMNVFPTLRSPR